MMFFTVAIAAFGCAQAWNGCADHCNGNLHCEMMCTGGRALFVAREIEADRASCKSQCYGQGAGCMSQCGRRIEIEADRASCKSQCYGQGAGCMSQCGGRLEIEAERASCKSQCWGQGAGCMSQCGRRLDIEAARASCKSQCYGQGSGCMAQCGRRLEIEADRASCKSQCYGQGSGCMAQCGRRLAIKASRAIEDADVVVPSKATQYVLFGVGGVALVAGVTLAAVYCRRAKAADGQYIQV